MNLEKDLQRLKKEKALKESAIAQLRKRSKDSVAGSFFWRYSHTIRVYVYGS